MRYIYYIAGIIILLTITTVVRLTDFKVELSEPAIIINDRHISKQELKRLVEAGSKDSYHTADAVESIITNQLLIQEAVRQGINEEESFRQSIQNYYEQSLVNILIDRKYKSFNPEIPHAMITKYQRYTLRILYFTKSIYKSLDDIAKEKIESSETVKKEFINLSGHLQFILLLLDAGQTSPAFETEQGYVTYRLDKLDTSPEQDKAGQDIQSIKRFLIDQKKRILFDNWMDDLRKKADIEILTDIK